MGLDMYLIKRKRSNKVLTEDDLWEFEDELIYWRKANAIHRFFCENGEEISEQVSYKIPKSVLVDLLNKCKTILNIVEKEPGEVLSRDYYQDGKHIIEYKDGEVIANKEELEAILPTQSGFFFGSTDYDDWYLENIERTRDTLANIIDSIDFEKDDIYYLASW